eukprot:886983-Ditylum_brightwellii.AAC.1
MTATKNDAEYVNTCKLVNRATNQKNLPPSHKASLSYPAIRANVSSLPKNELWLVLTARQEKEVHNQWWK